MATAELLAYALALIVIDLLVVMIFQIGKRFRTKHSHLKIYFWMLSVLLVSNLIQMTKIVTYNVLI